MRDSNIYCRVSVKSVPWKVLEERTPYIPWDSCHNYLSIGQFISFKRECCNVRKCSVAFLTTRETFDLFFYLLHFNYYCLFFFFTEYYANLQTIIIEGHLSTKAGWLTFLLSCDAVIVADFLTILVYPLEAVLENGKPWVLQVSSSKAEVQVFGD